MSAGVHPLHFKLAERLQGGCLIAAFFTPDSGKSTGLQGESRAHSRPIVASQLPSETSLAAPSVRVIVSCFLFHRSRREEPVGSASATFTQHDF